MYTLLKQKNEALRPALQDFTQALIRTPSPSLRENSVADLVQAEMERLGYDRVLRDSAGNVLGLLLGCENGPTLLLASHMDTVNAVESEWTVPPLSGRISDGALYGVGAADCKGGLAAQVYAGALLKRSMLPLRGNVIVAATVAEENGRSVGLRVALESTLPEWELSPDFAILGEPTGLGLYYGHDGWAEVQVSVEGMDDFAVRDTIEVIGQRLAARTVATAARPAATVQDLFLQPPVFSHGDDGVSRGTIRFTCRVGQEDLRQVLDSLRDEVIHLTPTSRAVNADVAVCTVEQKLYTGKIVTVRNAVGAWSADPFNPLMERARQTLAAAGLEAKPGKWSLPLLGMGTAGATLVNDFSIPTIGYGPGMEAAAHHPDEYVELEKLATAVYGTAAIAHGIVGVPVFGWTSDDI